MTHESRKKTQGFYKNNDNMLNELEKNAVMFIPHLVGPG